MTGILGRHDGLVAFRAAPDSYTAKHGPGFLTRFGFLPAAELRGCKVNLTCKRDPGGQALLFEGVTLSLLASGKLLLDGGRMRRLGEDASKTGPAAMETLEIGSVAGGFTRPAVDVAAVREVLRGVEVRHRFSGVKHHVAGHGPEYAAITSFSSYLAARPAEAAEIAVRWARDAREHGSTAACVQRADLIGYILAVLDGIEHDAPPHVTGAFRVYLGVLRGPAES